MLNFAPGSIRPGAPKNQMRAAVDFGWKGPGRAQYGSGGTEL